MSLVALPVEILLLIAENLNINSHIAWARTSSYFLRVLAGKTLYRRVQQVNCALYLARTITCNNFPPFRKLLRRCSDVSRWVEAGCGDGSGDTAAPKTTLLHLAVELGRYKMVQKLLKKGADISSVDDAKHTPLHVAARFGQFKVAKLLCENGAPVSAEIGATSVTALDYAVANNHAAFVELLLGHGARSDRPDTLKHAAITYCKSGDPTVLMMLVAANRQSKTLKTRAGLLALCGAIMHGHMCVAHFLVSAGVEPRLRRRLHLGIPHAQQLSILKGNQDIMFLIKYDNIFCGD
ncbi:hypothetical protein VTN49DRAFT_1355 [Thermomyces lanuginosus]|uniref:uncharacterized protein n=1 Tax=Thermomyces lanuginosus TaxID=5541 RepID=UPI003743C6A1